MGMTAVKRFGICVRHCQRWKVLALAAALAPAAVSAPAATSARMSAPKLIPEKIAMGALYNGVRMRVEGTAPAGSGVLVVIEGSEHDEFFNRKGRVGPIWLTVDRIHVKHAPSVFLCFGSAALKSLLGRQDLGKYQLDEAAIMERIHVLCHCKCSLTNRVQQSGVHDTAPDSSYARLLEADFLHLKQHEGFYREMPGTVHLAPGHSETPYTLEFEWPEQIPAGNYRVTVYACREHAVIAHSTATLQLVEVGFPEYLAAMAARKPWIYGIAAVLAAIAAGFLTDLLTSVLRHKQRRRKKTEAPQSERPVPAPEEMTAESHEKETTHRC